MPCVITAAEFCYVLFLLEVMRRAGELDLTKDKEKKCGNTNPAFCDVLNNF